MEKRTNESQKRATARVTCGSGAATSGPLFDANRTQTTRVRQTEQWGLSGRPFSLPVPWYVRHRHDRRARRENVRLTTIALIIAHVLRPRGRAARRYLLLKLRPFFTRTYKSQHRDATLATITGASYLQRIVVVVDAAQTTPLVCTRQRRRRRRIEITNGASSSAANSPPQVIVVLV